MPPPKKVKKLEALKVKGLDVSYPRAPWYNDNEETIKQEREERARRIREGANAELLE